MKTERMLHKGISSTRSYIKCRYLINITEEKFQELLSLYGNSVESIKTVYRWRNHFKLGKDSVENINIWKAKISD